MEFRNLFIFSFIVVVTATNAFIKTPLSRASFSDNVSGKQEEIKIAAFAENLAKKLGSFIRIEVSIESIKSRFKNDFNAKEWLSGSQNWGSKIGELWTRANRWMDARIGISLEGIGNFAVLAFINLFRLVFDLLKDILGATK